MSLLDKLNALKNIFSNTQKVDQNPKRKIKCIHCNALVNEDDLYCSNCGKDLNFHETPPKKEEDNKIFSCELENTNKYDCHSFVKTLLYFGEINKDELYEGYTDVEIKENGFKVYESNNISFPCQIEWDDTKELYAVVYKEHSNNYLFGNVPSQYNKELNEIINNKNVISGGMCFCNGYYEKCDEKSEKIKSGYDNYVVKIVLTYKNN